MHGTTHGASLSAVWGAWARELYKEALPRFAKYARKVWDVNEEDDEVAAIAGIERTEEFFRSIGMPTSLKQLGINITEEDIKALSLDATMNDTVKLSRIRPLDAAEVAKIYNYALNS